MKGWMEQRTLMELYGTGRLLLEAHRGVLSFAPECIRVGTTYGSLLVRGKGLGICCMNREQLVILGQIETITVEANE